MTLSRQTKDNLAATLLLLSAITVASITPPQHLRMSLGFTAVVMTCLFIIAFAVARARSEQVDKLLDALDADPYATEMATGIKQKAAAPLVPTPACAYGIEVRKKHPQFILAMHAWFFDGCPHFPYEINELPTDTFLSWSETASALVIKERHVLEPDGDYRQLLPYMVVRQQTADGVQRMFAYQRGAGVGEGRLVGKVSVGFGGHVDANGVVYNDDSSVDLRSTLIDCAHREKFEEIRIANRDAHLRGWADTKLSFGDVFITHNEGVQRMHLGVLMYLDVPAGMGLTCNEQELTAIGFRTPAELLAAHHNGECELEVWSRLMLERALMESADGCPND